MQPALHMLLLLLMSNAVVLDWDGVIFCDDLYREDLFRMLANYVPYSEVERLYQTTKDSNGFNDRALATAVAKLAGANIDHVIHAANDVLEQTSATYLYSDATHFIHQAAQANIPVYMLTAGNKRIQTRKITCSNLAHLFTDVVIVPASSTETAKETVLKTIAQEYTSILFFDDRLSTIVHLQNLRHEIAKVVPVYVNRIDAETINEPKQVSELTIDWVKQHFAYAK